MVPGTVPKMRQPTPNVCWATAATIMKSWKDQTSLLIATVMQTADTSSSGAFGFSNMFRSDRGMPGHIKSSFLQALGLTTEAPMSLTVDGWANLLKAKGPVWVTTNEGTTQNFAIHARVMIGISGDGTPDATFLSFVDPADGKLHSESVTLFTKKLEDVARGDLGQGADLRPQIVHY
jgi:hypothetical protein